MDEKKIHSRLFTDGQLLIRDINKEKAQIEIGWTLRDIAIALKKS